MIKRKRRNAVSKEVVCFRIGVLESVCADTTCGQDGEDFMLYRQRGPPFWVNVLILGILFPLFLGWTIVGTFWFVEVQDKTPLCVCCAHVVHCL